MTRSVLAEHLRRGDHVVVGQTTGEPAALVAELFDVAGAIGQINVFCTACMDLEAKLGLSRCGYDRQSSGRNS